MPSDDRPRISVKDLLSLLGWEGMSVRFLYPEDENGKQVESMEPVYREDYQPKRQERVKHGC